MSPGLFGGTFYCAIVTRLASIGDAFPWLLNNLGSRERVIH